MRSVGATGRPTTLRAYVLDMQHTPLNNDIAIDLSSLDGKSFSTLLADPPWRFLNRTGKIAPEHKRLARYDTLSWKEIASMPVADVMSNQ
jgi:hypothetical protein